MNIQLKDGFYLSEDTSPGISQIILRKKYKQKKDEKEVDGAVSFYGSWPGALMQIMDDPRFTHDIKTKKDLQEWIDLLVAGKKALK